MLPQMLDHVIRTFFPAIWRAPTGSLREVRRLPVPSRTVCQNSTPSPFWKTGFIHAR